MKTAQWLLIVGLLMQSVYADTKSFPVPSYAEQAPGYWDHHYIADGHWEYGYVLPSWESADNWWDFGWWSLGWWDWYWVDTGYWASSYVAGQPVLRAASTVTFHYDANGIHAIEWPHGHHAVPSYAWELMHDDYWTLPQGDLEDTSHLHPALAFQLVSHFSVGKAIETELREVFKNRTGRIYIPQSEVPSLSRQDIKDMLDIYALAIAAEVTWKDTNKSRVCYYVVYEQRQLNGRLIQTGHSSGYGGIDMVLRAGLGGRSIGDPTYGTAVPQMVIVTNGWRHEATAVMRGQEQMLQDYHREASQPTVWHYDPNWNYSARSAGRHEDRAVSRNASYAYDFWEVASRALGSLWGFTGYNPVHATGPFEWRIPSLLLEPFVRPPFEHYNWVGQN